MIATIDHQGRIVLDQELQKQLGVQPGDDVVVEPRGTELVIKAANGKSGLCREGNVLVHRGTCVSDTALAADRDERMDQLAEGLPK